MSQITIPQGSAAISYTVTAPSSGPFAINFPFFALSDLIVERTNADGSVDLLVMTTDYVITPTLADDGYSGGSLNTVAPQADCILSIVRETPIEKLVNYPTSGSFNVYTLNTMFSKLVAWIQEHERDIASAISAPPGEDLDMELPPAAERADMLLGFDGAGNPIAFDPDSIPPQATEAIAGKARIATLSETYTGTDDSLIVTPQKLKPLVDRMLANESHEGGQDSAITSLQSTDATHSSQIATLQAADTAINVRLTTAENDIDALQALPAGLPEAPIDGEQYARQNASWVIVAGSGGGGGWTPVDATETVKGIAEVATAVETSNGLLDDKIITPLKLKPTRDAVAANAASIVSLNTAVTNLNSADVALDARIDTLEAGHISQDGQIVALQAADTALDGRLDAVEPLVAQATEAARGTMEIATTAEVTAGTDDATAVTPLKMAQKLAALPGGIVSVTEFTASGNFLKGSIGTWAFVQLWSAAGSGARNAGGGGGGGGGAYDEFWILLAALAASVPVTIGAGGASVSTNVNGNPGGDTSFGTHGKVYGGAAGGSVGNGGGGGGKLGAGVSGGVSGHGGAPSMLPISATVPGFGSGAISGQAAGDNSDGGGGGGAPANSVHSGGNAVNGGGGGAARSGSTSGAGLHGGNSKRGGGGGGGGTTSAVAQTGGASELGGRGGDGQSSAAAAQDGTVPGGGGGGATTGNSGKGADGFVRVTVFK